VEDSYKFDRDYILTREAFRNNSIELRGISGSTKLVYHTRKRQWRVVSLLKDTMDAVQAIYNGTKKFPIGHREWYFVGICTDNPNKTYSLPLKLSKVTTIFHAFGR